MAVQPKVMFCRYNRQQLMVTVLIVRRIYVAIGATQLKPKDRQRTTGDFTMTHWITRFFMIACFFPTLFGCNDNIESDFDTDSSPFTNETQDSAVDEETSTITTTASKALFPTYEWMRHIPDVKLLSEFSIPGSHDSMARRDYTIKGVAPAPGTARAQTESIAEQLLHGIRFFDLRFKVIDYPKSPRLRAYHGPIDQGIDASSVFNDMHAFLKAHPSETVIVSIKEEVVDRIDTPHPSTFETLVGNAVTKDAATWATDEWVPRLGAVRGKIVLVRRFAKTGSWPLKELKGGQWLTFRAGINATDNWPTNKTGTTGSLNIEDRYGFTCKDYQINGDFYCDGALRDKWSTVRAHLDEAPARSDHRWYITFTSATRFEVSSVDVIPNSITDFAKYANPKLTTFLSGRRSNFGVIVMDRVTQSLAQSIISTND
jgi:1-phosphatidylinositol phosphodiesterase